MDRVPFILYRDVLLPLSETFVAAPVPLYTRYEPWLTGTTFTPHPLLDERRILHPADGKNLPALPRMLFKGAGIVPAQWLRGLASVQPRLLHAHFGPDGIFAAPIARRLGVPLVVTFWGFDATVQHGGPLWTVYRHKRRALFERADAILAVSDFIRTCLIEEGCPPEKVRTHHACVDTGIFRPDVSIAREQILLFVGRLVEKKGCGDLLQAVARLDAAIRESWTVAILGEGPLESELRRLAAGLPNVVFLGARPPHEVLQWMQRASIFALPSRRAASGDAEGLPIVILEAQSTELPVVSTFHAGIPEAVRHGETGLLCNEGDIERLTEHIAQLMTDRQARQAFGAAGRARVMSSFSLPKQTARLEEIYDDVITAYGRRRKGSA